MNTEGYISSWRRRCVRVSPSGWRTLIVCGGDFPYYCVESRTLEDKGLGLSEAQTQDITIQAADYERSPHSCEGRAGSR